ncbi:dehydrogenase/reductase SDR family member 7 [Carettochelys insculpta]|uniref:dehydrogenase/reductase SDR family member 7 n=1 Tax=Carettochelys insculpta TaxID=44489 RepID=UPI003EBA2ABA
MEWVVLLLAPLAVGALLYLVGRWLFSLDGDLTLLWAEWRGKRPEKELPGKVVWVTGASSGIGEELAYQLAKIGSLLVLSARRENELERVKKQCLEISNLNSDDILVVPLDLTDRSSHEGATKTVLQHFGRIDVLVNNGGRSQRSLFVDTKLEVYQAIMELNYLGTISLTKHVLNHIIQRKKGKIVTMSSVMGIMGAPLATGYCASKHALQGFFNSLRPELAEYPEITVSTICPGPVQSKIIDNVFTEELSKSLQKPGDQSHKMPTDRCVRLTLVSIANDLNEAWVSDHPYLAICYLWQYAPTWAWWLLNKMGKIRIRNFKSGVDADVSYSKKKS